MSNEFIYKIRIILRKIFGTQYYRISDYLSERRFLFKLYRQRLKDTKIRLQVVHLRNGKPVENIVRGCEVLPDVFKSLSISFKTNKNQGAIGSIMYEIFYQGWEFIIQANNANNEINITLINACEFAKDDFEQVKIACNNLNSLSLAQKASYLQEDKSININLTSTIEVFGSNDNVAKMLKVSLDKVFMARNILNELVARAKKSNPVKSDPLFSDYQEHDAAMLLEHDIHEQPTDVTYRFNEKDYISVAKLIYMITEDVDYDKFSYLKACTDEVVELSESSDIAFFDILRPCIKGSGPDAAMKRSEYQLFLKYDGMDIPVMVKVLLDDEKCIYYRITVYQPDTDVNTFERLDFKADAISVVVAYDKTTDGSRKAEFEYMWKDAQDKVKMGNLKGLNSLQRSIYFINNCDIASDLYWGNKHYKQGRYFEAVMHLEPAFKHLQIEYEKMNESERDLLLGVCMRLGYCYNELKMHKKALYYLEICFQHRQIDSSIEYINTLVACNDFRALQIIGLLIETTKIQAHVKDAPKEVVTFFKFLIRSKSTVLINRGKYKEAEKLLNKMINDPVNKQYALKELERLNNLKKN